MKLAVSLVILAAVGVPVVPAYAQAKPRGEQNQVRDQMEGGRVMPLREIESRVLPTMRDYEYLGPEYDPVAMAYRLKFIQNGRVMFVDVDARSGRIIGRSR